MMLDMDINNSINWFSVNSMRMNQGKCHIMFSSKHITFPKSFMINNIEIETENSVNLLGLTIDSNLTFSNHISQLCKRARNRLAASRRMIFFISEDKAVLLASTFVMSQFNYSPLIWMFCSKFDNASINKIHKRALRTVYQDFTSSFLFFVK